MGIKSESDDSSTKPTFSQDVLKIDVFGPDQDYLTVIDVPGIFRNITPGTVEFFKMTNYI